MINLILNVIVLLFEILYYSLFIKYARRESKFNKLLLLFTFITIIGIFIGTSNLPSYLILILMMLFGLKYIVKLKISLYDMLIIFIMLIFKVLIETPTYLLFINILNRYLISIIPNIIKILVIRLLNNKITKFYKNLKIKWDNNNFYIRYIFSIFVYTYCIITAILLIFY